MAIEAWYMDDSDADQREEHRLNPNQPVSMEELAKVGGMCCWADRSFDDSIEGIAQHETCRVCMCMWGTHLPTEHPHVQIGVLYWTFDADTYKTDPKFAVRFGGGRLPIDGRITPDSTRLISNA